MKIFFKLIDYLSCLILGSFVTLAVCWLVSPGWNMMFAMFAGMVVGMTVLFFFLPFAGTFSTFFDFMPPSMIIAMIGGMGAGMAASSGKGLSALLPAMLLFSVSVQLMIDLYNLKLKGEVFRAE